MKLSSWSNPSMQSGPTAPRFHRWAARLTLFVACIAAVASSQPSSPPISTEYQGAPLSLSTAEPRTTRRLVARISLEKHAIESAEVTLKAEITARWKPTDPTNTMRPWLRARLIMGANTGQPAPVVLGEPGQGAMLDAQVGSFSECTNQQTCSWDVAVEFELQANVVEGSVDLDWKVTASASVEGTAEVPEGFTVELVDL